MASSIFRGLWYCYRFSKLLEQIVTLQKYSKIMRRWYIHTIYNFHKGWIRMETWYFKSLIITYLEHKRDIHRYSLIFCIKLLTNTNTVHSCKCAYTFDVSKMMSEHETRRMHKNDFNDMQTRFPILKHF